MYILLLSSNLTGFAMRLLLQDILEYVVKFSNGDKTETAFLAPLSNNVS